MLDNWDQMPHCSFYSGGENVNEGPQAQGLLILLEAQGGQTGKANINYCYTVKALPVLIVQKVQYP